MAPRWDNTFRSTPIREFSLLFRLRPGRLLQKQFSVKMCDLQLCPNLTMERSQEDSDCSCT